MKIVEVTVGAGRTLPHPSINYSALKVDVIVRATIDDGEDHDAVTEKLQAWANEQSRKQIVKLREEALERLK